jgi:hypothetical protein
MGPPTRSGVHPMTPADGRRTAWRATVFFDASARGLESTSTARSTNMSPWQNLTKAKEHRSLLLTSAPPCNGDIWGMNCSTPAPSHQSTSAWSSSSTPKGWMRWDNSPPIVLETRRRSTLSSSALGGAGSVPHPRHLLGCGSGAIHLRRPLRHALPHIIGEGS